MFCSLVAEDRINVLIDQFWLHAWASSDRLVIHIWIMNVCSTILGYKSLASIPKLSKRARRRVKWVDHYYSHGHNALAMYSAFSILIFSLLVSTFCDTSMNSRSLYEAKCILVKRERRSWGSFPTLMPAANTRVSSSSSVVFPCFVSETIPVAMRLLRTPMCSGARHSTSSVRINLGS